MRKFSSPLSLKLAVLFGAVALLVSVILVPAVAVAQTQLPTASQVASQIRVGWNLGNTLEAICGETAWGNPMVTQQFVNSVKAAGFNAIRIPAAWDCHANQSTMQIDAAWMSRVKQVVDYAISADMYVIINIHWDGGWLEEHPLYSYQTAVNQKQQAYWTQIANTFKNYNEHLLFAGTNEVHADYGEPTTEHITVQQSYNQTFVNAVRATGGNNASRTLVIQTYNTNMWHGLNYFAMPTDTIANRLMVEVHYYDPYDYTLNESGPCLAWGAPYTQYSQCSWAQEAYVDDLFNQVRAKWVAQGIPVIIGEYGVATRPNLNMSSREYFLEYINKAATTNGIKTFYWDNGVASSQTNGFALFDRNSGSVSDRGALDAIMRGVGNPPVLNTLTVTKTGTGSGTVTSSPAGISCGSTCSAGYTSTTSVTLTAQASSGSSFGGWGGACSGTSTTCTVSMSTARNVTANFALQGTTPPPTTPPVTTPPPGTVSINSGGPATGSFVADQYFSGGSTYTNTRTINMSQIPTNPPPVAVFNTERYGAMTYTIPNRSGTQTVTLYFAETYVTAAGQRVFNVTINGAAALSNFDIFASAGGADRAIARSFSTTANSSGQVVIQFTAVTQNPKISGITVAGGGTPPVTTPPPTTPPATTPPVTTPPPTTPPVTTPPPTTPPPTTPPVTTPPPTTPPPTTPPPGGACSPVTSTITVPFTYDGAGTLCWQTNRLGSYINSWNLASLTINGVDFTNRWANSYPPAINGSWYISYRGSFPWSHFEAR